MSELKRDGHRQRAKEKLFSTPVEELYDYQLLESLLFYSIPRRDVKPLAYSLINKFGTLGGVMNASLDELISIEGLGENSAVLIKLVELICEKSSINTCDDIKILRDGNTAVELARGMLSRASKEKMLLITLDNKREVISNTVICEGAVNYAKIEIVKIIEKILADKASAIIIAHNHPHGTPTPSQGDISFSSNLAQALAPFHIALKDHIIVGENDCCSMSLIPKFAYIFK